MKKVIGWLVGGGLKMVGNWIIENFTLVLIAVALLAGVWVNSLYNKAGQLSETVAAQERLILKKDSTLAAVRLDYAAQLVAKDSVMDSLKNAAENDSLMYAGMIADLQRMVLTLRKDRDYWKDWSEKLESGEFCVEWYGLFKKKKRLVKCVE
jgi:hypothetical protein